MNCGCAYRGRNVTDELRGFPVLVAVESLSLKGAENAGFTDAQGADLACRILDLDPTAVASGRR